MTGVGRGTAGCAVVELPVLQPGTPVPAPTGEPVLTLGRWRRPATRRRVSTFSRPLPFAEVPGLLARHELGT